MAQVGRMQRTEIDIAPYNGEAVPNSDIISLERKRKVVLAHDMGAGAPCLNCGDACPGLDLHYWRKICRACKCRKDEHDVHDEDADDPANIRIGKLFDSEMISNGHSRSNGHSFNEESVSNQFNQFQKLHIATSSDRSRSRGSTHTTGTQSDQISPRSDHVEAKETSFVTLSNGRVVTEQSAEQHHSPTSDAYKYRWVPPGLSRDLVAEYFSQLPPEDRPVIGTEGEQKRRQALEHQSQYSTTMQYYSKSESISYERKTIPTTGSIQFVRAPTLVPAVTQSQVFDTKYTSSIPRASDTTYTASLPRVSDTTNTIALFDEKFHSNSDTKYTASIPRVSDINTITIFDEKFDSKYDSKTTNKTKSTTTKEKSEKVRDEKKQQVKTESSNEKKKINWFLRSLSTSSKASNKQDSTSATTIEAEPVQPEAMEKLPYGIKFHQTFHFSEKSELEEEEETRSVETKKRSKKSGKERSRSRERQSNTALSTPEIQSGRFYTARERHDSECTEPLPPYKEPDYVEVPSDPVEIPLYQTPVPIRRVTGYTANWETAGDLSENERYGLTPHVGRKFQHLGEQYMQSWNKTTRQTSYGGVGESDSTGAVTRHIPIKQYNQRSESADRHHEHQTSRRDHGSSVRNRSSIRLKDIKNERIARTTEITGALLRQKRFRKQLPLHDCDPNACHALTVTEKHTMHKYVETIKKEVIGMGQVDTIHNKEHERGLADHSIEHCTTCQKRMNSKDIGVFTDHGRPESTWHPNCFNCCVCNERLVDMLYFYNDGKYYCGRHFGDTMYPRCAGCDELIFAKEYTRAEDKDWHLAHFCCFGCDKELGGYRYMVREPHPYCIECYMAKFARTCTTCKGKIGPDTQRIGHKDLNWHATPECFHCETCSESMVSKRFVVKGSHIFCSTDCKQQYFSRQPANGHHPSHSPTPIAPAIQKSTQF